MAAGAGGSKSETHRTAGTWIDGEHDGGRDGRRCTGPNTASVMAGDAANVSGSASHNRSIRFNFLNYFQNYRRMPFCAPSGGQHQMIFYLCHL